jgi:uncharacterized protein (TIGR00255 family)
MNSMTGFGKAEIHSKAGDFTVEISSVNSRFLEVSARLPRQFSLLEHKLRELVNSRLNRGKVNVFVGFTPAENAPGRYRLSESAIRTYHRQLVAVKKTLKLSDEIGLSDLLALPDIAQPEETAADDDLIWSGMRKAADKALGDLIRMRRREGTAMAQDMKQRLKVIAVVVKEIVADSSLVVEKYRRRLTSRIGELVEPSAYDPGRLEQEIAVFAEKSDISEECTRLSSHLSQYKRSLGAKEPVGKRLNFILQEMNREVNTIASKCPETRITTAVIVLKEEIEKLRELVQNVE